MPRSVVPIPVALRRLARQRQTKDALRPRNRGPRRSPFRLRHSVRKPSFPDRFERRFGHAACAIAGRFADRPCHPGLRDNGRFLTTPMKRLRKFRRLAGLLITVAAPLWARSQRAPGLSIPGLPGGSSASSSAPWNIVVLLTLLTVIPAIVLSMTPFVRLLIVFHFLRQALGTQTTPSNQTLIGLSLILTFFLMQPVGAAIYSDAIVPLDAGQITVMTA